MTEKKQRKSQERLIRLDLGCGSNKPVGFIGADRFGAPGVDVILDLDQPLPFADNSVDLILASHSLEHVADLLATIKEIYRISKPGAQVCIVAPYSQQSLNYANPYHQQTFNEHTPRFWTAVPETPVDAAEYYHPHASAWGLSESDSSSPGIDLRCLKMEFFYFPEYQQLPPAEQRAARKKFIDVCDQIVYHLFVVKPPSASIQTEAVAEGIEFYESPFVTIRKLHDLVEIIDSQARLKPAGAELSQTEPSLPAKSLELDQATYPVLRKLPALFETQTAAIAELRSRIRALKQRAYDFSQHEAKLKQDFQQRETELTQLIQKSQRREAELTQDLAQVGAKLVSLRNRKIYRWLEALSSRYGRYNAWHDIAPPFQRLKDDSLLFSNGLRGFRLQPSPDLQTLPFLAYPLTLARPNLTGLLLAPVFDIINPGEGRLGIEIVSPEQQIVAQVVMPVEQIDEAKPTCFQFDPLPTQQGRFWLRVFARDITGPIRIFEWRKALLGLGPLQRRAFCGFIFQE